LCPIDPEGLLIEKRPTVTVNDIGDWICVDEPLIFCRNDTIGNPDDRSYPEPDIEYDPYSLPKVAIEDVKCR
jgi:hypothetical protein